MNYHQIGTVTIHRDRAYDETEHGPLVVPAGSYPVVRHPQTGKVGYFLSGYPNLPAGRFNKIGDGLFVYSPGDHLDTYKSKQPEAVEFIPRWWEMWELLEILATDSAFGGESPSVSVELR